MKVFVVTIDYGYEGYTLPEGVFSTKELAKKFVENYRDKDTVWDISEYDIDELVKKDG